MSVKVPSSPVEAGLPPEFGQWRDGQKEAVELCLNSPERVQAICAPTGFGKSGVAVAIAKLSGPTLIVTHTKGLMDQYMDQFSKVGMTELRGRDNYPCQMRPDWSCEDGWPARCPYRGMVQCPYAKAEMEMATSSLGVTNYAKWCSAGRMNPALGHFSKVIFDEGHHIPEAICDAMMVTLHSRRIEEDLGIKFPKGMDAEDLLQWKRWAGDASDTVEAAMLGLLDRISSSPDPKLAWIRNYSYLRNLLRKLGTLRTLRPTGWVVDTIRDETKALIGYQFEPIRPGKYAEAALLFGVEHIVSLSAIQRPKTMILAGIPQKEFRFTDFPSSFSPLRSPIYYVPTMRVDARQQDFSALFLGIDQFLARRPDRKGIIHTVSFDRQRQIVEASHFRSRMLINKQGSPTAQAIQKFRDSAPGTILVSPSVGEGYDFPGDDCRWQIMAKIPFEPPSKIVKARQEEDKEYRGYRALQEMINAFGRGMRSEDDWCENIMFDKHIDWFWGRHRHLAPEWFHAFFRASQNIPKPLNPEEL